MKTTDQTNRSTTKAKIKPITPLYIGNKNGTNTPAKKQRMSNLLRAKFKKSHMLLLKNMLYI